MLGNENLTDSPSSGNSCTSLSTKTASPLGGRLPRERLNMSCVFSSPIAAVSPDAMASS